MGVNSVQTVGNFTATFTHPLLGGTAISLQGFKQDQQFFDSIQIMDNSKVIALVGGSTATLTNAVKAGTFTFNCVRISTDILQGDVVLIALTLQSLADSTGGLLRITYGLNGGTEAITYTQCTLKTVPPLKLAGNDLPDYPVVFNYGNYFLG